MRRGGIGHHLKELAMDVSVQLPELWLPILLSAVAVFIASALAWMVLPHHKKDIQFAPDEGPLLEGIARAKLKAGQYMFPTCTSAKDLKDPQVKARWDAGPWGMILLRGTKPNLARNLVSAFIFYLVVGVFVGYLSALALDSGAPFRSAFRVAGTAAVIAYCLGGIPNAIFFGRSARAVVMDTIDGIVYGLITGAIFGWLWPAVDAPTIPGA
jgi:hypothetical protein